MAELNRRVLGLRGALALAGVATVAASMTQVVGTMAAPAAVRTATLPASTSNYFPTPLPESIGCTDDASGLTGALVSWSSAGPGMSYRVQVWTGTTLAQTAYTDQTSFRPGGLLDQTYRVAVSTVNTSSGGRNDDRVVSTGSRTHDITLVTSPVSLCVADSQAVTPNVFEWENQAPWTPAAPAAPASAPAEAASPDPESGASPPSGTETSTREPSSTREPLSTSAPSSTNGAATASPTTTDPLTDTPSTATASPDLPLPDDSATETRQEATLGNDPIAVGMFRVRLDLVDGSPHVIVTSDGTQLCTVAMPGATAIAESKGMVEVTGGDQARIVDPSTCEIS